MPTVCAKKDKKIQQTEIETLLHKTIQKITEGISTLHFNTCVSSLMILVNAFEKEEKISKVHFDIFLKLLAPFAPYITEELWSSRGHKTTIHHQMWPKVDLTKLVTEEVTVIVQVNGKTRAQLKIKSDSPESVVLEAAKGHPELQKWINGSSTGAHSASTQYDIKKVIYVKNRLINLVIIQP